ncbi:prenyltransferase-like protein [Astrocystis sublimbata]|nr:prenyltransferase-like protein [Astrocystis sublimbata]
MAAVAVNSESVFSSGRFIADYKKTADHLGAPYSEEVVQGTLTNFPGLFDQGSVSWRATSRDNDQLNYRFYIPVNVDTISMAAKAGYIDPTKPMARLAKSWSSLFNGEPAEWCDFDSDKGLAKTWILLKGLRSVDHLLDADEVSESVRAHRETFHKLGLKYCHFVAVDHHSNSLNLYFTVPGPITEAQATAYTALAGAEPPTAEEFADMREYVPEHRFAFAVTMEGATGKIKRVSIYALNIPEGPLPKTANDRLRQFFAEAPCYDSRQARTIGWSYGNGNSKYMKGEASYTGELGNFIRNARLPPTEAMAKLLEESRASMSF